jgi:hypothetical protein
MMNLYRARLSFWKCTPLISLSLLLCSAALGQGSEHKVRSQIQPKVEVKIRGMSEGQMREELTTRNREFLHPGRPLVIVGNEEGGNSFRAGTPMLLGAGKSDGQLDMDEAYERRLSMYKSAAVYHSAPVASVEASPMVERLPRSAAAPRVGIAGQESGEPGDDASWVAQVLKWGGLLSLLVILWNKRHDIMEAIF